VTNVVVTSFAVTNFVVRVFQVQCLPDLGYRWIRRARVRPSY